jgi:hypothetical protein
MLPKRTPESNPFEAVQCADRPRPAAGPPATVWGTFDLPDMFEAAAGPNNVPRLPGSAKLVDSSMCRFKLPVYDHLTIQAESGGLSAPHLQ